jgi:hypothetical protein
MYGSRGATYLNLRRTVAFFPLQEKDAKMRFIVSTLSPRFDTFSVIASIAVELSTTAAVSVMIIGLEESSSSFVIVTVGVSAQSSPPGFHLKKSRMVILTLVPMPPATGDIVLILGSRVSYSIVNVSLNAVPGTALFVLSSGEYIMVPVVAPL